MRISDWSSDVCSSDLKHFGAAVLANIFRIVADQTVTLASDAVLDLAGRGEFEAFLHTALGLELGHFCLLYQFDDCRRPRQPITSRAVPLASRKGDPYAESPRLASAQAPLQDPRLNIEHSAALDLAEDSPLPSPLKRAAGS